MQENAREATQYCLKTTGASSTKLEDLLTSQFLIAYCTQSLGDFKFNIQK